MMSDYDWSVVVFRTEADKVGKVLVDLYRYVKDLIGVKDLHFLIRDRVNDDVVFNFRILLESKEKNDIENVMAFHLGKSMSEDGFAINPKPEHPFSKYVAWSWRDTVNRIGLDKFTLFCDFLSKFSKLVVEMAEKDYFHSKERVEMAHIVTWMLGCTEYGILSVGSWEIGYHDRIDDKNHAYLKHIFKS
jgi:hypothetical protein